MLLDTDVLIDLIRGHAGASAWIRSLPILPDVSGYAAMELVAGCRNMLEINHVQQFLTQFQILWPEHIDLDRALHRYAPLSPTHGIGILDMLIATTAIAHSMPLVTFNVKHFKVIPNLITIQPYTR